MYELGKHICNNTIENLQKEFDEFLKKFNFKKELIPAIYKLKNLLIIPYIRNKINIIFDTSKKYGESLDIGEDISDKILETANKLLFKIGFI